ncbi:MAG TPA: ATP-dependent DNA helicase RecG [Candidatus Limnocylindria bacterium]|nr:ATP-dependent DNA helicase RecG [Candidatus Limnocylindria bacterium]
MAGLVTPLQYIKGVGPQRARQLARKGLATVEDALFFIPIRHEDRTRLTLFRALQVGETSTCAGTIVGVSPPPPGRRMAPLVITLRDETGLMTATIFGGRNYLARVLERGRRVLVHGKVSRYKGTLTISVSDWEIVEAGDDERLHTGRLVPIYSSTEGLTQRPLRRIMASLLDAFVTELPETLPEAVRERRQLMPLREAVRGAHLPSTDAEREAARRRLAFDDFLLLQLGLAILRSRTARARGIAMSPRGTLVARLRAALPFALTAAQERVWTEIRRDMAEPYPMHRLLQGDVGSGKTIVAALAVLTAIESGYQAAVMAPTEILAEQHVVTFRTLLEPLGVRVTLLTSAVKTRERGVRRAAIAGGEVECIVGTHALVQEQVDFRRLGLAVVDEQHRFGVRQRLALAAQAAGDPDLLVMSATPIPRSLALTLHGDLDLSVLDERPPGRKPVRTQLRSEKHRDAIYMFVANQVALGRQAFVVFPIIDESETLDLRSATAEFEVLRDGPLARARVALLHGQMPGEAKDRTMLAFAGGEIDVLVATTVIEVGIDVPNASVRVIEHGERCGLSQLHQLRGRVGRGADESWCVVIADGAPETLARLDVFARTEDGFVIAEEDLRLRGMGDLFGARQHGLPAFRFFDPMMDLDLLTHARELARAIVEVDPGLERPEHVPMRAVLESTYGDRVRMFETG